MSVLTHVFVTMFHTFRLKHFMVYYANVKDPNKRKMLESIYKQFQEGFLKAVEVNIVHSQYFDRWTSEFFTITSTYMKIFLQADLNETYEEENIVPLLNGLNRLSEDAPNEVAW